MENKVKKYNFLKISIYTFLFLILFWVISYFSFDYYQKISVNNINSISLKKIKNLDEFLALIRANTKIINILMRLDLTNL